MRSSRSIGRVAITLFSVLGISALTWMVISDEETEKGRLGVATATASGPAVVPLASAALWVSLSQANQAALCEAGQGSLERAREEYFYQRRERGDAILSALIERNCLGDVENQNLARFQYGYSLFESQRYEESLETLHQIEGQVPVADYLSWIKGQALDSLERPGEAADEFQKIVDLKTSPLHYRALARRGKSLHLASRHEEALPVLEEVLRLFPDYPRRHLALHYKALSLEALDRKEDAVKAHQQSALEFPYRWSGQASEERIEALALEGIRVTPLSVDRRFEQYRQLSIDKFWPLAHEKLEALRDEITAGEGNLELENRILQQLALNAFNGHLIEDSLEYFAEARARFDGGKRAGFQERTLFRNYSFALGRLGKIDESLEVMEAFHRNSPRRTRLTELGSFYMRYGLYEEAYETYDQLFTNAQKQQWDFAYLQYKTGRLEEAAHNLERLANRSRGERRAQYLYWLGRTQEESGDLQAATATFRDVGGTFSRSYYGLQARSRLVDMEQRLDSGGLLAREVQEALNAFDLPRDFQPRVERQGDLRAMPLAALPEQGEEPISEEERLKRFFENYCQGSGVCIARHLGMPLVDFAANTGISLGLAQEQGERSEAELAAAEGLQAASEARGERIRYNTEARIYWDGRQQSPISFANYSRGEMIGPVPQTWSAYRDQGYRGGLGRFIEEAGELFPAAERARWLFMANWNTMARDEIRHVALELRSLASRGRAARTAHDLPHRRWEYFIDNRRRNSQADFWGMRSSEKRYPIPEDRAGQAALLSRQQEIFDRRNTLRPLLVEAMQEVGDYHLVRRHALGDTSWLRQPPQGEAGKYWAMAYPRAYPEKVIPTAKKYNINPYVIWALMLVESSFNPDSISIADAKGLLQVIPRTGLKIAELFGSEDFGPFDLLQEDTSIEQGIFYLSRLIQKFHGQELLAFAGYNGGPHRVRIWLDYRGHQLPHDEFIEEIPFNESREYAKKVLRFLHTYLQIYEGYGDELYVGQNLRLDYLDQPDF